MRNAESRSLMSAADVARGIANRLRKKADGKTGDDRKHWVAMSAGALMVSVRLIELADDADGAVLAATDEPEAVIDPGEGLLT